MTTRTGKAPNRKPRGNTNMPLLSRDGHPVLDLDSYVPFLLSAIASKWLRSSSTLYLREFGIGVTEWRILGILAIEPRVTAYRICQIIGLDKAAASRALRTLESGGLVRTWREDPANHRKLVEMTEPGWALHDRIVTVAHRREALLLSDLSRAEVAQLADLLRRVHGRVPDLPGFDPGPP